jgi:hypothetical protein
MRSKIKVAGCTVRGRKHIEAGLPCQDKVFTCRYRDGRSAVIALADGAGSSTKSHVGAQFVVSKVGDLVIENFFDYSKKHELAASEIVNRLQLGLNEVSDKNNIPLREYASTLLFTVIRRRNKTIHYLAGHIGDGIIAMMQNKTVKVLSHPETGEFASSTYFITGSDAKAHLRIYSGMIKGNMGFLVASDGAAESLYRRRDGVLATACSQIFKWFDRMSQQKAEAAIRKNMDGLFKSSTLDDCGMAVLRIVGQPR